METQERRDLESIDGVSPEISADRFTDEGWVKTSTHVPSEMEMTIYVNQKELVTVLCTPSKLNCLVLGFLYDEGVISSMKDVASMRVCEDDSLADVRLKNPDFQFPKLRTLTSGCGGGTTFKTEGHKVASSLVVAPHKILSLMKQFQDRMELYRASGGVHASALSDGNKLLVVAEDIGRHNTLDKLQGECLLRGFSTRDGVLLTTGRISSEMLLKAAKMQVPLIISRTSPTERAVALAKDLGVALVGYARASRMLVYTHPERLGRSK